MGRGTYDITGRRFGSLVVLSRNGKASNGHSMWLCLCDCGKTKTILSESLKRGSTRSCGCLRNKRSSERLTTHGGSNTRLHRIWKQMRTRCNNSNYEEYAYYGGRGIKICDAWNDFSSFREWAEANGYAANLTIDRIDVNKGYSPENCRWATMREQNRNKRDNHIVEINGMQMPVCDWAGAACVSTQTVIKLANAANNLVANLGEAAI